jgi:hypothetical protein
MLAAPCGYDKALCCAHVSVLPVNSIKVDFGASIHQWFDLVPTSEPP